MSRLRDIARWCLMTGGILLLLEPQGVTRIAGTALGFLALLVRTDSDRSRVEQRRLIDLNDQLTRDNAELADLATIDRLTGLKNRHFFEESLGEQFSFARRQGLPFSLVMIDVDHFKGINDTFGHRRGDETLAILAVLLRSAVRDHDRVSRFGGEEFAILLPATGRAGALNVSEWLRRLIEKHPWPMRPVTASFGVATLTDDMGGEADLVEAADRALYHSKLLGRNRVTHASSSACESNESGSHS